MNTKRFSDLSLFFMLYANLLPLLKADVKIQEFPFLIYSNDGLINSYPEECVQIFNAFAEYSANFTLCSIKHARPIRLCEKCLDHYINFHSKYRELLTTIVNGTSCQSLFISHDRLDVVLEYHDSILAVWDKGNCNACYDWSAKVPQVSNETKNFNKMFNETMECIKKNIGNNSEVCERCMQSYIRLDEYYKSLSKDAIGVDSVCMDIVDSMNTSRSIWSNSLNCCKLRKSPEIVFLCCSAIISILPILFYLAVRYCGPIRDLPNVLKQSRFKQSFMRSINGRIN